MRSKEVLRVLVVLTVLPGLPLGVLAMPAPGQDRQTFWNQCVNTDSSPSDEAALAVVRACSALIGNNQVQNNDFGVVLSRRGDAYLNLGNAAKALEDYDIAVRAILSNNEMLAWTFKQRAEIYRSRQQYNDALNDLGRAVSLNPKLAEAFSLRGDICYLAFKNIPCATEAWDRAIALDASMADSSIRASALAEQGRNRYMAREYAEAAPLLDEAMKYSYSLRHDEDMIVKLATARRRSGDLAGSLRAVGTWEGVSAPLRIERAISLILLGRELEALIDIDKLIHDSPRSGLAIYLRGIAQQRLNSAGITNPRLAQPNAMWDQAENDILEGGRLEPESVDEMAKRDGMIAAAFRPAALPRDDAPATTATPAPSSTGTASNVPEALPGGVRGFLPVLMAAVIGLAVMAFRLVRKR